MNRISRNQKYRIESTGKLPLGIVVRDTVITTLAWSLALYLCTDFILQLSYGILHEFDTDPLNDLDWALFAKNLRISFFFSGSVLTFITAWTISNLLLLRRTQALAGRVVPPLKLEKEVEQYGCSADDVRQWRMKKILTIRIDDSGKILKVEQQN